MKLTALSMTCVLCVIAFARAQDSTPTPDAGAGDNALSVLVSSAVQRLAAAARADAQRLLDQKQYPEALKTLQTAHELDPRDLDTTQRLAELQHALGHAERAEALYRELIALAPNQASGYIALADLLASDHEYPRRLAEAAELYARAQEQLGSDATLWLRKARLEAARGLIADAERDYTSYLAKNRLDDALALELGDFYRDTARPDDALSFYRRITGAQPARVAAQRIFELEVDKEARRYGLARGDDEAAVQARGRSDRARMLIASGQLTAAEHLLRDALTAAPDRANLHADLADALRAAGRDAEAELEYLRAIALDGSQPEVYLHVSELYLNSQPPRAAEAAWLLERALVVRPEWTQPRLLLARAYRVQGDLPRALSHVTRFLAQTLPGPERDAGLLLQASLQAGLGASEATSQPPSAAVSGADHLARARTFLAHGQTDAALAELQKLAGSALAAPAIDLQARVLYAAGRSREAAVLLTHSFGANNSPPETHELLGLILAANGASAGAREHWLTCEKAGVAACTYQLARLDSDARPGAFGILHDLAHARSLWNARQRLAGLRSATYLPVSAGELAQLRADLAARWWAVAALLALGSLLLMAALLAFARARWGGSDLAALLAKHPDAAPEVQRVLSAIRHEVLKHNTLMLAGLAETLQRSEPARDAAEHLMCALFGEDGRGGAAQRFDAYVDKLLAIGLAHGERLNLKRRDPALSELHAGFATMSALRDRLLRIGSLREPEKQRLASELLRANEQLNVLAQSGLAALLDGLRSLHVHAPLLHALFDQIRHEPALAAASIAPLQLEPNSDLPCSIAIPAQAFDDILRNLFRNALQTSLRHANGSEPIVVGLSVRREVDEITGLASVALRVRDRSPEILAAVDLQGATIEAGLGLTADLVARNEGMLDVEADGSGFSKAVVVRLPVQRSEAP